MLKIKKKEIKIKKTQRNSKNIPQMKKEILA